MVKNRKCLACSTSYSYCPDCSRADKLAPTWKAQFCSEDCMSLWMTLTRYNMSRLTKSEAKEIISALTLKPIDVYASCVQRDYAKVFEPAKKSRKIKKLEPIVEVETEPVMAIIEQPVEDVAVHEVILKEEK